MHPSLPFLVGVAFLAGCSQTSEPTGTSEEPKHPGGAMHRWQQRLNEDGRIPQNAIVIGKSQRDAVVARAQFEDAHPGINSWTWRGPGNIGGRIRGLVIHPNDPNTIWAGSASGGLWMTTDGAASWSPLNDFLPSLTIGCMTMDPADPTKLFIGTGEGFFDTVQGSTNTAAIQGAGIFVSTDSGVTWTQLTSTATPDFYFVNRIAIDPNNSQIILTATNSGIWRSTDGGTTWMQRTTSRTLDLDYHPTDSMKAVAGLTNGFGQYTLNGGVTWVNTTTLGLNQTRVETAYARSNPDIVYASVTDITDGNRVWKSIDGGMSYTAQTPAGTSPVNHLSLYTNTIWVDPTNPDRLLIAGVGIYHSDDGGVTFVSNRNGGTHSDHHIIVEHPDYDGVTNTTIYEGNDGGVYRRETPFSFPPGWTDLQNNLGVTQFYGAAVNPTTGDIVGGTQDNGSMLWQNGSGTDSWIPVFGGDGGFCAWDPTDPLTYYVETQRLRIRRTIDGGATFENVYTGIPDQGSSATVNFIPFFMLDPNNPNRMLAAARSLWISDDIKTGAVPTWSEAKLPSPNCPLPAPAHDDAGTGQSHYAPNVPCNISTIAVAEGNSDVIWVGHNNGEIYKTANGTDPVPTWTPVHDILTHLPHRWVSRIVIDQFDTNRAYASFLGYAPDSLWRTTDGGQSWVDISGSGATGIPDVPVSALAVHPKLPGRIYAGTDFGLFVSLDDGNTWTTDPDGPGATAIDELIWKNDRTLIAVTHGRGIYEADLDVPLASHAAIGPAFGCGAVGLPVLVSTEPICGETQTYNVTGLTPNAPWSFAFAPVAGSSTDFGNGCIVPGDISGMTVVFIGNTDGAGAGQLDLTVPSNPSLIGATLTTQVVALAAGGPLLGAAELTNALAQTFGF